MKIIILMSFVVITSAGHFAFAQNVPGVKSKTLLVQDRTCREAAVFAAMEKYNESIDDPEITPEASQGRVALTVKESEEYRVIVENRFFYLVSTQLSSNGACQVLSVREDGRSDWGN